MVTVSARVASYIRFPSCPVSAAQILQLGSSGLPRADALDEAELESLRCLDQETKFPYLGERPAPEMLAGQRDADPLVQPLHGPQRTRRRGQVIDEEQPAARAQDARHLGDRTPVIGDGAQSERAQAP